MCLWSPSSSQIFSLRSVKWSPEYTLDFERATSDVHVDIKGGGEEIVVKVSDHHVLKLLQVGSAEIV